MVVVSDDITREAVTRRQQRIKAYSDTGVVSMKEEVKKAFVISLITKRNQKSKEFNR